MSEGQKDPKIDVYEIRRFSKANQLTLLGYCWVEGKIELYLLNFGSHENFYQEQKRHRKADLKLIG
ncbi:hypothetical protein C6H68_17755 [Photorhabdus luminescens]|nr:hypothetical protein C6H68_17755 [Photorhabdus luminescens]